MSIIFSLIIIGLIIAFSIVGITSATDKSNQKKQNQYYRTNENNQRPTTPNNTKPIVPSTPQQPVSRPQPLPYVRKRFMSMNEAFFYYELKKITNKYNYELFSKVRIADLVETKQGLTRKQWGYYFGIIKAKHADFVVCTMSLQPVLIVELDDRTHDTSKGMMRDSLVDRVYYSVNYPILHTRGIDNLETKFCEKLNIQKEPKTESEAVVIETPCATVSSLGVEPSAQ